MVKGSQKASDLGNAVCLGKADSRPSGDEITFHVHAEWRPEGSWGLSSAGVSGARGWVAWDRRAEARSWKGVRSGPLCNRELPRTLGPG